MVIAPSGMTPLLQVYDIPQALTFYRDVLGFTVVNASPEVDTPEGRFSHWMTLRLGSATVMLNSAYDEGERPRERVEPQQQWHRDTYLYFSVPDVDAVYQELRTSITGLQPPTTAPYGMRQLYLTDPDGYSLCFQAPIGKR